MLVAGSERWPNLVSAFSLCRVQGTVCGSNQFGGGEIADRRCSNPEACGDDVARPGALVGDAGRLDCASHSLCHAHCIDHFHSWQQHQEFFTTKANRMIAAAAEFAHDDCGDPFQAKVPARVSISVVEQLEMIDVDEDHGDWGNLVFPRSPQLCELDIEMMPIGQSRQGIAPGRGIGLGVTEAIRSE